MIQPPRTHNPSKGGAKTFRSQPQSLHDWNKQNLKFTSNHQILLSKSSGCRNRMEKKKNSKARTPHTSQNRGKAKNGAGIALINTRQAIPRHYFGRSRGNILTKELCSVCFFFSVSLFGKKGAISCFIPLPLFCSYCGSWG